MYPNYNNSATQYGSQYRNSYYQNYNQPVYQQYTPSAALNSKEIKKIAKKEETSSESDISDNENISKSLLRAFEIMI